jgi:hypothetical protein
MKEEAFMPTSKWIALAIVGAALAGPTSRVAAQTQRALAATDDARWYPWVGCWQRSGDAGAGASFTCVRPGSGASADILTIANGAVDSREHLIVDGAPHPIDKDGCHGSQTATWSASGNRVYIGAAYSCSGNLHGRSSRMFAILPSGVWLEVRDVHAGGGWVETVTRFHDAGLPASVPADIRSEISRRELAVATARAAASAPVSTSDIAEATRAVDTVVVQTWLAARGQGLAADASDNAGAGTNAVRVYEGAPATPAPTPSSSTDYSAMNSGCDAFGCYEQNAYSSYNGFGYSRMVRPYYYYGFGPSYYVPFVAPVVVIRGGSRGPSRLFPLGSRPPVGHTPGGHGPVGRTPVVQAPVSHAPSGQAPRGGMTGRIRP